MQNKEPTLLERLLIELGIDTNDAEKVSLVDNCLWQAGEYIKNKRSLSYVEKKYESIQFQIALRLWNIRGVEGEIYHMENGITRQYSKDGVIADLMCKVLPRAIVGDWYG